MRSWGCSTRTPMAKGFWRMATPWPCSISKVSRALWPGASTRASQGISSPLASTAARTRPAVSKRTSASLARNRYSAPRCWASLRISTAQRRMTSVPTWGFAR
ncbi:MAG: hypothetical protein H6P99_1273 [Holophagaceae bacterium]|nr:hypothetical protein [Holophagaceae bacterium]